MKTNFAFIDECAEQAIANYTPVTEEAVPLGGFMVPSEKHRQENEQAAKNKVASYVEDRATLKKKLAGIDIKPKAFLSRKMWDQICKESGLYQMTPERQTNKIMVSVPHSEIEATGGLALILPILLLCYGLGLYYCFGIWGAFGPDWKIAESIGALIGSLATATLPAVLLSGLILSNLEASNFSIWLYMKITSYEKQIANLFSDKTETGWTRTDAKVILPQPPEPVLQNLTKLFKLTDHEVSVAAVADAIAFEGGLKKIYSKGMAEEKMRRQIAADPIIYVRNGSAVAIIDQFGDFPIEKETVEKCMTAEFVL